MALVGTFEAIAEWAAAVIAGVDDYNKVWAYRRKVRTLAQLSEDFGTGTQNGQGEEITRGWMVNVKRRPLQDRQGASGVWGYEVDYICLWSVEDRGANEPLFKRHVETVASALMAVARPTAFTEPPNDRDDSSKEIAGPVEIDEFYTVQFPLEGRLHHRADMSQVIRLRQMIRS